MYAYNAWANARVLEVVSALSEEQFSRVIPSSFPSVRDTLAHVVAGEWIWLRRWRGENPSVLPAWLERPTLAVLREQLAQVELERDEFLATLDEDATRRVLAFRFLSGTPAEAVLLDLLLHVVNHSTYHRGQLATLVRQLGTTFVATDLQAFAGAPLD
jgi:uncharacterized damage-inducible protein DinB